MQHCGVGNNEDATLERNSTYSLIKKYPEGLGILR